MSRAHNRHTGDTPQVHAGDEVTEVLKKIVTSIKEAPDLQATHSFVILDLQATHSLHSRDCYEYQKVHSDATSFARRCQACQVNSNRIHIHTVE